MVDSFPTLNFFGFKAVDFILQSLMMTHQFVCIHLATETLG